MTPATLFGGSLSNVNYEARVVFKAKLRVKTSQRGKLCDYIVSSV